MKVEIDYDRCEGYGLCAQSAPDVFAIDDDGDSHVLQPDVDGSQSDSVRLAEVSCPMKAVKLT